MITFTQKDTIGAFQFFLEHFEFRYEKYTFHLLLKLFLKYLDDDINKSYLHTEREDVIQIIKKHIFSYYKKIDFNLQYTKEEIKNIVKI